MTQFTVALGNSRCSTRVACGGGESRAHCLAADAERGWPALLRAGLCPGLSPKEQVCLVVTGEREGVGKGSSLQDISSGLPSVALECAPSLSSTPLV